MIRYCFFILVLISQLTFAQNRQGPEKIKALKTAHITQELDLSAAEAEVFWPVYNRYQDQLEELRRKEREELAVLRETGLPDLDESEAGRLVDRISELKTKELSLHQERIAALKKVISFKKILRLHKAEEDFKRMLLNRFRGRRGRQ